MPYISMISWQSYLWVILSMYLGYHDTFEVQNALELQVYNRNVDMEFVAYTCYNRGNCTIYLGIRLGSSLRVIET